ncbi:MAG: DUF2530 domain-containing protein [Actinomycetota bacterium]
MADSPTPGRTVRPWLGSRPDAAQADSRKVVLAGTALWTLAALALLPFWNWLGRHDHRIWFWTCVAGTALGVLGLALMRKHRGEGRTR